MKQQLLQLSMSVSSFVKHTRVYKLLLIWWLLVMGTLEYFDHVKQYVMLNVSSFILSYLLIWMFTSFCTFFWQANTIVADDIDHGPGRNLTLVTSSLHTEDSTDWVRRAATRNLIRSTTTPTKRRSIPSRGRLEDKTRGS